MGEELVCPACRRPIRTPDATRRGDPLTPREKEVLRILLTVGCSNKEIAFQLHLTEHTAKSHMRRIFVKLGVSTRTELCILALTKPDLLPAA